MIEMENINMDTTYNEEKVKEGMVKVDITLSPKRIFNVENKQNG